MISATLLSAVPDTKLVRTATVRVSVEMNPSSLLEAEAIEIRKDLERMAPYSGFDSLNDLESDDILKYLKTLTWMRCQRVNERTDKVYQPYRGLYRFITVPVLPYQLFVAMGLAYDKSFAIQFNPEYQIESADLLSPDELIAISDLLRDFVTNGFAAVSGLPKDIEGELDFMALAHVEDQVTSYHEGHPVYGFLASFFRQQQLNEVTGTMCRMIYGYDSDYRVYLSEIHHRLANEAPAEVRHD